MLFRLQWPTAAWALNLQTQTERNPICTEGESNIPRRKTRDWKDNISGKLSTHLDITGSSFAMLLTPQVLARLLAGRLNKGKRHFVYIYTSNKNHSLI